MPSTTLRMNRIHCLFGAKRLTTRGSNSILRALLIRSVRHSFFPGDIDSLARHNLSGIGLVDEDATTPWVRHEGP